MHKLTVELSLQLLISVCLLVLIVVFVLVSWILMPFVFLHMYEEWSGLILLICIAYVMTVSCVSLIQTGPSSPLCLNPEVFGAGTYSVGFSGSTCLFVKVVNIC